MAVYSEQHQYIFFANPQTASKAIALTLRQKLGGKPMPEQPILRNGKQLARVHHTTYSQILAAGLMTQEQLDKLFKFTCVRNPFDQLVSKYLKHCERLGNQPSQYPWLEGVQGSAPDNSFPQWLDHLIQRFGERRKMENGPLEFLAHADLVIRFESLQAGFDEFLAKIGVKEPLSVTEFNVTKARADTTPAVDGETPAPAVKRKKKYTEYYDADSIAKVERLYAPIIERFEYRFGA